jgi:hypothetical protein
MRPNSTSVCGLKRALRQYLCFCTNKASQYLYLFTSNASERASSLGVLRQYLYVCTSNASKLGFCVRIYTFHYSRK